MDIYFADKKGIEQLDKCDFSFDVEEEIVFPYASTQQVKPVSAHKKQYDFNIKTLGLQLSDPSSAIFLAAYNKQPAGFIVVSTSWTSCAQIDEFAVDVSYRRTGAGKKLMDAAVDWVKSNKLQSIRLETQSNNVAACRFYEKYGFILGGYDRFF